MGIHTHYFTPPSHYPILNPYFQKNPPPKTQPPLHPTPQHFPKNYVFHHVLKHLLEKHCVERRLFNLYWKMVKAGYIEFDNKKRKYIAAEMGVPQGGIISPLLSNLILHEFDIYMEARIQERIDLSNGEPVSLTNPQYTRWNTKVRSARKKGDRPALTTALWHRSRTRTSIPNPRYSRLKYVRYADD